MKRFLTRVVVFLLWFGCLWYLGSIAVVCILDHNARKGDSAPVYIWGDSQTRRGIDLAFLSEALGRDVLSLAANGVGVYDFSVFADRIPPNSQVLIGFSPIMFGRRGGADRDDSGFSWRGLSLLLESGVPTSEIARVAFRNFFHPFEAEFRRELSLYQWTAEIRPRERIELFQQVFSLMTPSYSQKRFAFTKTLERLRANGCTVVIVDFPEHAEVQGIIPESPYGDSISALEADLKDRGFPFFSADLQGMDRNPMRDYTHLNELGARELTDRLALFLLQAEGGAGWGRKP